MSLQLNDHQVLELIQHLYKSMQTEEHQRLLDIDNLDAFKQRQIKPLYPHKQISDNGHKKLQKYTCGEICFDLSSGSTCCSCCRSITPPDSVHQEFGLGANIYFNFMKHFSFCFIFLSVLSIIAVGIAYYIALKNEINPTSNYQLFFFSTTMGSFSSSYFRCQYSSVSPSGGSYVSQFALQCPQGQIHQFGPILTDNSQPSLANCKLQRQNYQKTNPTYYLTPSTYTVLRNSGCTKQSCTINVTFSSQPSKSIISYPYSCVDPSYPLFGNKFNAPINVLTYVFVGIDLFITLGFIFFLCSEKEGEDNQVEHFKQFQLSLKDFSVKVKGFNSSTFDQEFHSLLQTINQRQGDFSQRIIQMKTPDDQQYIDMTQSRKQKYSQLFKFMQRNFFDSMIDPNPYRNFQDFYNDIFASVENYVQFKKELLELLEEYRGSRKMIEKSDKEMNIYLVMNSSKDVGLLKKFRTAFCCNRYLVSKNGKLYSLEDAPIPDMLQWPNKTKWTCMRVLLSWILTLAIVVASYILFGYIQWEQKRLLSEYNFKVDCQLFYPNTTSLTTFNTTLYSQSPAQYTQCYCSTNYFSLNVSNQVSSHCAAWRKSYLLYLIIPVLISLGFVIYNLIVSLIFKKLTQFQGHFFITDEMFSYTIKRSFILIMNMGLIIVLLNFNYNSSLTPKQLLFLFQGQYQDITSDWYISIGSIIIMTMIFNITFPFMQLFVTSLLKCLRKCIDKRCWCRKTSQKYKLDYINLYSSDVFPIEERYALVISIFWITMLFNCVIPALNVIAALSFFLLQCVDKVLVFKFFKTPPNFDESLHKKFMKTLYVGILLHLAASAFLLSQPNLVPKDSNFSQLNGVSSTNKRLNILIQTYYIIPYVALFILLIVYGLFKQTIIGLLSRCNKKIQRASLYKIRNMQSFYESLTEYQLSKLKVIAQKELCRLLNLKRQKPLSTDTLQTTENSQLYINPHTYQGETQSDINIQIRIYTKTLDNITRMLEYLQTGQAHQKAKLIGMPGYQISLNQGEADKEKKILQLDSVMEQIILTRR